MTTEHAAHRTTFWWSTLSALTILAGILAVAAPMAAGLAATLLVGWFITFSAAIHLWLTFEPQRLSSRLWHVLAAAIYGVGGLYLIARPDVGLLSLTLFVSVMLVVAGVFRVAAYFSLEREDGCALAVGRWRAHNPPRSADLCGVACKQSLGSWDAGRHHARVQWPCQSDVLRGLPARGQAF